MLSAYIRTKNEAANIQRCIEAALVVAEEVMVVDSGSSDDTIALAEAAGARVVHNDWPGFGYQKRFAEEQCKNDWLLDLDADEIVTPELAAEIKAELASNPPPERCFSLPLDFILPSGRRLARRFRVPRKKLYNKTVYRMPAHVAWDQFKLKDSKKIKALDGSLDHYAFDDLGHCMIKQNGNSSMVAKGTKLPGRTGVLARIFLILPFYFFKHYIIRGYYTAGVEGYSYAMVLAFGRWLRDAKRAEMQALEKQAKKG
jgi:glycosyltransferase involved in cell wall biosynthesis